MPRNSSGTYALPAGNPVVTGTLIESAWANGTMSDLGAALTDSLDRYGRGSMLAPLLLTTGTPVAPALSFSAEGTSGFYRQAAGVLGFSVAGAEVFTLSGSVANFNITPRWAGPPVDANDLTPKGWVDAAIATAGGAFLPLVGGTLTGPLNFRIGDVIGEIGRIGFVVGATERAFIGAVRHTASGQLSDLFFGTMGAERMRIDSTGNVGIGGLPSGAARLTVHGSLSAQLKLLAPDNGFSELYFGDATNNNVGAISYTHSADSMGFYTGGSERMRIGAAGHVFVNNVQGVGITGSFFHQVQGSYLAYGDNTTFRALNSAGTGAIGLYVLPGAGAGGKVDAEGGPLALWAGGAERMRIDSIGNVGIAMTPPIVGTDVRTLAIGGIGVNQTVLDFYIGATRTALFTAVAGRAILAGIGPTILDFETGGTTRASISAAGVFTYGGLEVGYRGVPRVTAYSSNYNGKCIAQGAGFTINVGDATAGMCYSFYNDSAAAFTITQGGGLTMRLAGTTLTGNRTLAPRGLCTVWWNAGNEVIISGSGVS